MNKTFISSSKREKNKKKQATSLIKMTIFSKNVNYELHQAPNNLTDGNIIISCINFFNIFIENAVIVI